MPLKRNINYHLLISIPRTRKNDETPDTRLYTLAVDIQNDDMTFELNTIQHLSKKNFTNMDTWEKTMQEHDIKFAWQDIAEPWTIQQTCNNIADLFETASPGKPPIVIPMR